MAVRIGLQIPDFQGAGGSPQPGRWPHVRPRPACHPLNTPTCYFRLDVGASGERVGEITDQLAGLAELGFGMAIGAVASVWDLAPLEVIGSEIIPAVATL